MLLLGCRTWKLSGGPTSVSTFGSIHDSKSSSTVQTIKFTNLHVNSFNFVCFMLFPVWQYCSYFKHYKNHYKMMSVLLSQSCFRTFPESNDWMKSGTHILLLRSSMGRPWCGTGEQSRNRAKHQRRRTIWDENILKLLQWERRTSWSFWRNLHLILNTLLRVKLDLHPGHHHLKHNIYDIMCFSLYSL